MNCLINFTVNEYSLFQNRTGSRTLKCIFQLENETNQHHTQVNSQQTKEQTSSNI